MKTTDQKPSSALLAEVNPDAMALYRQMRATLMPPPGVEPATGEIVLAMQMALRGHEVPVKVHAMRAMALGVTLGQLEALLMASLGVSMVAFEISRAIEWLREAHEEQHGK